MDLFKHIKSRETKKKKKPTKTVIHPSAIIKYDQCFYLYPPVLPLFVIIIITLCSSLYKLRHKQGLHAAFD